MKLYTLLNLDRTKRHVTSERKAFKIELKNMIESIIFERLEKNLTENKDNKKEVITLLKLKNGTYDDLLEIADEMGIIWNIEYK